MCLLSAFWLMKPMVINSFDYCTWVSATSPCLYMFFNHRPSLGAVDISKPRYFILWCNFTMNKEITSSTVLFFSELAGFKPRFQKTLPRVKERFFCTAMVWFGTWSHVCINWLTQLLLSMSQLFKQPVTRQVWVFFLFQFLWDGAKVTFCI